jgi:superoxide dismutase, Cu-Zn family
MVRSALVLGVSGLIWYAAACSGPAAKDEAVMNPPAAPATDVQAQAPQPAKALIVPLGKGKAHGELQLVNEGSELKVVYEVRGLKPNSKHGFHIHEFGDCTGGDGMTAGSHFNPGNSAHGAPGGDQHHAGDLGNITADAGGKASGELRINGVLAMSLIGRGVIIHAKEDDLKTQPAGESGERIACGVIGLAR